MGLKVALKAAILRRSLRKRKKQNSFDEKQSELYALPKSSGWDVNNSYYFTAHDKSGESFFFRYAMRNNCSAKCGVSGSLVEVWFAYIAADGSAWVNEKPLLPTALDTASVECIKALQKWKFTFNGKMLPVSPDADGIAVPCGKAVDASFCATFLANSGLYEFSRDTDVHTYSKALASEKWSKAFFAEFERIHQTHIEQVGFVDGQFKVDKKLYSINTAAIRDHSYGRRSWSYMNRHTWIIGMMQDGLAINANEVRYPVLNENGLQCGYKINGDFVANVRKIKFENGMGQSGRPQKSGSYNAKFSDKTAIDISFRTKIVFPFSFEDEEGGYVIYEGVADFLSDGKIGHGIVEFGYNADEGRYKNGNR